MRKMSSKKPREAHSQGSDLSILVLPHEAQGAIKSSPGKHTLQEFTGVGQLTVLNNKNGRADQHKLVLDLKSKYLINLTKIC